VTEFGEVRSERERGLEVVLRGENGSTTRALIPSLGG
jgi:hypothetical protein